MKGKNIIQLSFILALLSLLGQGLMAQASSSLPTSRTFDWDTAGYQRDPTDNLPGFNPVSASSTSATSVAVYDSTYYLPIPSGKLQPTVRM
jgi:hypothetical protein